MVLVPSMRPEPVGFVDAGFGLRGSAPTEESLALARRMGANGVAARLSVGSGSGLVLGRRRRWGMSRARWAVTGAEGLALDRAAAVLGEDAHLLVRIDDDATADGLGAGCSAMASAVQVWAAVAGVERLTSWAAAWPREVHRVLVASQADVDRGAERLAAVLAERRVDAVLLHESLWSAGLATLFHRFAIECVADGAERPRLIDRVLAMGIDAVVGDHADQLAEGLAQRRSR